MFEYMCEPKVNSFTKEGKMGNKANKELSDYQKAKRIKERFPNCMALFCLSIAAGGMVLPVSREAALGFAAVAVCAGAAGAKAFYHGVKKFMRDRQRAK